MNFKGECLQSLLDPCTDTISVRVLNFNTLISLYKR